MKKILLLMLVLLVLPGVMAQCVDLDDPSTYQGKIVRDYGELYLMGSVQLCQKDYYFTEEEGDIFAIYIEEVSDLVLDCNGATFHEVGTGESAISAWGSNNLEIMNCNIVDWPAGNTAIDIQDSEEVFVHDNTLMGISTGFSISDSYNSEIYNNDISGFKQGIDARGDDNISFYTNRIYDNGDGVVFDSTAGLFYDNYFNNVFNDVYYYGGDVEWNSNLVPEGNIMGGSLTGGNFWGGPQGTGYSTTCADDDRDYFCDEPYDVGKAGTDNYPLKDPNAYSGCVDLDDPSTYQGKIVKDDGRAIFVLDDVQLCQKDYYIIDMEGLITDNFGLTIDCNGARLIGDIYYTGISVDYDETIVQNCELEGWSFGIYDNSLASEIVNNSFYSNSIGLGLNGEEAVAMNNYFTSSYKYGIDLIGDANQITSNEIVDNNNGIRVSGYDNLLFNNDFDNENDNAQVTEGTVNIWNAAEYIVGPNIVGGPTICGNFWGNPQNTGFSETCTEREDVPGICSETYKVVESQIDNCPLAAPVVQEYDLQIEGGLWIENSNLLLNENADIKITLKNSGASVDEFTVSYYDNDLLFATDVIRGMNSNELLDLNQEYLATEEGIHFIKVIVDSEDVILETDEENNEVIRTLFVGELDAGNLIVEASASNAYQGGYSLVSGQVTYNTTYGSGITTKGALVKISFEGNDYFTYTNLNGYFSYNLQASYELGTYDVAIEATDFTLSGYDSASFDVIEYTAPSGSTDYVDLYVSDISTNPGRMVENDQVNLTVNVRNGGNLDAYNFLVEIYKDDQLLDNRVLEYLAGHNVALFNIDLGTLPSGPFTIKVVVDGEEYVIESNEQNNIGEEEFYVYGPNDIELSVDDLWVEGSHLEGNDLMVYAEIYNDGEAPAQDFFVTISDGATIIGESHVDFLDSQESLEISIPWSSVTAGWHYLKAEVDYYKTVSEVFEDNNILTQRYYVYSITDPLADLQVLSENIQFSNAYPLVNEETNIIVYVTNIGEADVSAFSIDIFEDDTLRTTLGYFEETLLAGETTSVSVPYSSEFEGSHVIGVELDAEDLVLETTNANNQATRALIIRTEGECLDNDEDGYGVGNFEACTYQEVDCNDENSEIYPGAEEICDGVDNNCDGVVDEGCYVCEMKTDYAYDACTTTNVVVTNDLELDAYLTNYGFTGSKYQNLKIDYDVTRDNIDIHVPCKLTFTDNAVLTANTICLDAKKGVLDDNGYDVNAQKVTVLSEEESAQFGKGSVINADSLYMESLKTTKIGINSLVNVNGPITLISTGDATLSVAKIREGSQVTADSVHIEALKTALIGINAVIDARDVSVISTGEFSASDAIIKQGAEVYADSLIVRSSHAAKVGDGVIVAVNNNMNVESTGSYTGSVAEFSSGADVTVGDLSLTSGNKALLGINTNTTVFQNFHMDASNCVIKDTAVYTAATYSGACFN